MESSDLISKHFKLNPLQKEALVKLRLSTIKDLLFYFPNRYGDASHVTAIDQLTVGENVVVYGKVSKLKTLKSFKSKIPMSEGIVTDDTGSLKVVWFNQAYIAKMLTDGSLVRMEGKVSERKQKSETGASPKLFMSNPRVESVSKIPNGGPNMLFGEEQESHVLYPAYSETKGISSSWLYHKLSKVFTHHVTEKITEVLPSYILEKYKLPSIQSALVWIHTPKTQNDALAARKRFAFEEVFLIQVHNQKERFFQKKSEAFKIQKTQKDLGPILERFPFTMTAGQERAVSDILSDFHTGHPMARLLEGDVGSGKTAVAAATVYAVNTTRPKGQDFGTLQTAYMAPTEILAKQQFESFIKYFSYTGVNIALITGSGCKKFPSKINPHGSTDISRTQLLKWVANGEIAVIVGTHALISKSVAFKNLAYVVIDEQHRFGTLQRQKLVRKDKIVPHLLSMSATPIPRTLALTVYGDLDISVLDEMPQGRKPIITKIAKPHERPAVYEQIKKLLNEGRQAYIICPRIEENDPELQEVQTIRSVKQEAKRLQKDVFQEYKIDILHSKMNPKEKERVMKEFEDNKIKILVSTSVVEVGVNVPNATVIIIEGAERFGLAQLHQLRGRVNRSSHQAYCYICTETESSKSIERLNAFTQSKNGFELSEYDLKLRGAGDLYGRKQWGVTDLGMEALQNIKMVEAARTEAKLIIEKDPELTSYPLLLQKIEASKRLHLE